MRTENNVTGTLNVLLAARDTGVKRVICAGSSSAYGDTPTLPKREDMAPSPISPCAVSKLAGEHYMKSFYRVCGLETVTLRYFNVFGPRQNAGSPYSGVIARFTTQMLAGTRPLIFGDGRQSRDFTFDAGAVAANFLASQAASERVSGRVFNVATGKRFTLLDLYNALKDLTGFSGSPEHAASRSGDIEHSLADTWAERDAFGYAPAVDFLAGWSETVEWYRNRPCGRAQGALVRDGGGRQQ
jgi:UDP-glucose 4-epimerase